jgi:hypothetical protein
MNGTTAPQEAEKIVAELPDRISDVIKPFARESPDHPALVQGNVTWSYGELAAVVADTALILKHYDIRPGDRVMIASENSLALVALILAIAELDAWSVVVNPRLSAREVDLVREHNGARRVFYTIKVPRCCAPTRRAARGRDRRASWIGNARRRAAKSGYSARAGRGGSVAPDRGAYLYLGHDRQPQRGNADPPLPAVQRADNGCAAQLGGQSLLRAADLAHCGFLGHLDRVADGRRHCASGAVLRPRCARLRDRQ